MQTRLLKLQRIEENLADLVADLLQVVGHCPVCHSFRSTSTEESEAAGKVMAILEHVRAMKGQTWAQEVR